VTRKAKAPIALLAMLLAGCASDLKNSEARDQQHRDFQIIEMGQPAYPRNLLKNDVEGCVVLVFDVSPTGRVHSYRIFDSQPKGVFDNAAVSSLVGTTFGPKTLPGFHATSVMFTTGPAVAGSTLQELGCAPEPSYEELNKDQTGTP
jgi:TonB family protein